MEALMRKYPKKEKGEDEQKNEYHQPQKITTIEKFLDFVENRDSNNI